jgi:sulfur carrier protein
VEVVINGKAHRASASLSLAQAVALLTDAESGVAAAVNGDVVRRTAWDATPLSDGDEVEVLTAVQGG